MKLHSDRQGCALAAIRLIEDHTTPLGHVIDFDEEVCDDDVMIEMATVLSAATWCAHVLVGQMALHTGLDRDAIIATLREEAAAAFINPEGDNTE